MKPTDTVAEITVESALNELREMFPANMCVIRAECFPVNSTCKDYVLISVRGGDFVTPRYVTATTLSAAMNAVRAWKEQQLSQ